MPVLSVIIPAYNEATRVGRTLEQVLVYLHAQPFSSELIVVSDGSTDDTGHVVESYFAAHPGPVAMRLISYPTNRGKGYAVRQGLLAATGTVALFSDADLSTPIEELHKVVDPILDGNYDVVFGSRALDRSLIGVHQPWLREYSGRVFNQIMQWATGLPYADTQCGFKAFRLAVCRPVVEGAVLDRFGFDVELIYLAHKAGLRLLERPVRWDDAAGSKVGLFSGLDGFRELYQLRRRAARGAYDEALRRTRAALAQPGAAPKSERLPS
ncbi:dolichyl-phosphate beta-glucosyltransferase [Hymenobacter monticola]|uniref:dolichyl-phosphate beta-glucosyltransferase n=1 Tax=Hymenobacter monticola TaxID=1705399 RepID=A0ABY4B7I1_9BACT|nr:dolichyl-phosphate beta-glucosyltransferase [Hymenobacter monticola]UOE35137.1 glycosyltransferase family 2 protein [Hymenobacter monticola]